MSKILPFKQIAEAVSSGFGIFKHTATGKYSARRSISGVLVIAAAADMTAKGDITTNALILAFYRSITSYILIF